MVVTDAENRPVARPVALITGASSGIGETFARKLAGRGYDLILVARRADRLQAVAASVPTNVEVLPADLTADEGLRVVEGAIRNCAQLELLINNAGFGTLKRFWVADLQGQEAMHKLHVMATLRLTHAALSAMVERGHGAVINVSSVAGFGQSEGNVSYCATKAWMTAFTLGLDMELRGAGSKVTVQALCPGFTLSEFHDTLGVDRKFIPRLLWMQADTVVEASLRGLERGDVMVIPGLIYQVAAAALRYIPYGLRRRVGKPGPLGKDERV
jgi:short-subunit dehydrogenase